MKRYCTSCGELATQQTDNLFVCTNQHPNFIDAVPGATVYILKDDQVLFGVRNREPNSGGLNIAGGFLDLGETAEQAAVREAKEEFNVDIELVDFLGTYTSNYGGKPVLNITFVARYAGGDVIPGDDMSGGDPVWRSMDNLPNDEELSWEWQIPAQRDLQAWWQAKDSQEQHTYPQIPHTATNQ